MKKTNEMINCFENCIIFYKELIEKLEKESDKTQDLKLKRNLDIKKTYAKVTLINLETESIMIKRRKNNV